jgi:hypothetical protein
MCVLFIEDDLIILPDASATMTAASSNPELKKDEYACAKW